MTTAMSDVLNPVEVEAAIRDLANRITKGVRVVSQAYEEFLAADRAYDRAVAEAYMSQEGAAHERKYAAELLTGGEREARDVADAKYRYADRQARALESELRALQSIGASIRTMFGAPQGVGR